MVLCQGTQSILILLHPSGIIEGFAVRLEQLEQLAEQLQQLAEQLEQLAEQLEQLAEQLEQLGVCMYALLGESLMYVFFSANSELEQTLPSDVIGPHVHAAHNTATGAAIPPKKHDKTLLGNKLA